jgi:CRP-like cAMP-binding protein
MRPLLKFVLGLLTSVYLAGVEGEDKAVGQKHETAVGSRGSDATGLTIEELAGIRFFAGVPGWALERLAGSAAKRRLEQGALVVRQNDEARAVYFLLSGAVQILVYFEGVGDLLMGVHREPGSLIAWSAFRAPYRHTSSMRCEEPTEVMRMPRDTFEEIFEEDPYLGYLILKKVAGAMDNRLEGAVTFLESLTDPGEL